MIRREGPTKTEKAVRVVSIDVETVKTIRELLQLRTDPDSYLFTAPEGGPIDQDKLNRIFSDAQRALGIRVRGLYSTKDSFCSIHLSRGGSIEWLSEQTGVAVSTLRRHYALYERTPEGDAVELARQRSAAAADRPGLRVVASNPGVRDGAAGEKIVAGFVARRAAPRPSRRKGARKKVEQKGFEPEEDPEKP